MRCSWNGSFHFETSDGEKALPEVLRNNITVKAWKKTDGISPSTVIGGMTVSTWFGGDRSGTNSGTRLFLSGNPSYPGLVRRHPDTGTAQLGLAYRIDGDRLAEFREVPGAGGANGSDSPWSGTTPVRTEG